MTRSVSLLTWASDSSRLYLREPNSCLEEAPRTDQELRPHSAFGYYSTAGPRRNFSWLWRWWCLFSFLFLHLNSLLCIWCTGEASKCDLTIPLNWKSPPIISCKPSLVSVTLLWVSLSSLWLSPFFLWTPFSAHPRNVCTFKGSSLSLLYDKGLIWGFVGLWSLQFHENSEFFQSGRKVANSI